MSLCVKTQLLSHESLQAIKCHVGVVSSKVIIAVEVGVGRRGAHITVSHRSPWMIQPTLLESQDALQPSRDESQSVWKSRDHNAEATLKSFLVFTGGVQQKTASFMPLLP